MKEWVAVLLDGFSCNPGRDSDFRFGTFGTRTQQASLIPYVGDGTPFSVTFLQATVCLAVQKGSV